MTVKRCAHKHTKEGDPHGYSGSVASPPWTDENPRAHGNICYQELCLDCGAIRKVNVNNFEYEYSIWRMSDSEITDLNLPYWRGR